MNIATEAPASTLAPAGSPAIETGPILLAVSGSSDGVAAARAAGNLASVLAVGLHVVHTWLPLNLTFGYGGEPPIDIDVAYGEPAAEVLRAQVAELQRAGIQVAGEHLVKGLAPGEISDLAANLGAQLIVTGGRGLGLVKRLVLGSVSQGVARAAHIPVLVVPGRHEAWPPERIVVGFDASGASRSAAEMACAVTRATGAQLIIATVVTTARLGSMMPGVAAAEAEELLLGIASQLREQFAIPVGTAVLGGDPAHALLSLAAGSPPAMLAVGSRGEGVFRRLAFGSVSTAALQGAHGAVLITHQNGDSS